jgi:hypothetical protein
MIEARGMCGKGQKCTQVLVGKAEGKRIIGISGHR